MPNEMPENIYAAKHDELGGRWSLYPFLNVQQYYHHSLFSEMREALEEAAKYIERTISYSQSSYETPPEPTTQADYEADQLCCGLYNILAKTAQSELQKEIRDFDKRLIDKALENYDPELKTSIGEEDKGGAV